MMENDVLMNWPVELLEMLALQQEKERATGGALPAKQFGRPATEDQLRECELRIGCKLDIHHREFLRFANGWENFSGGIALFSTEDFLGSERYLTAQQWIREFDRAIFGHHAKHRKNLIPIAKSEGSTAFFAMRHEKDVILPDVMWFSNEPVEDFPTFDDMFAAFKEYTREAIDYWKSQPK